MDDKIRAISGWLGNGAVNFFGPPFSGKDTQAKKLAERFGGMVVSGGDILRHSSNNAEFQRIMAAGGIIPSELFLSIIPPFFSQSTLAGKPLFLSSIGRLMEEVPVILNAADRSGHTIKAAVLLDLSEAGVWRHYEIAQNLHDRGDRADDNRDALRLRLEEFAKTKPVIDYYQSKGLLITVDDTKSPDEVTQEIIAELYTRAIENT